MILAAYIVLGWVTAIVVAACLIHGNDDYVSAGLVGVMTLLLWPLVWVGAVLVGAGWWVARALESRRRASDELTREAQRLGLDYQGEGD